MTEPPGSEGWFADSSADPDDDARSSFAVVIGSVGALIVAGAMTLAIVFAFGDGNDEPSVVPQPDPLSSDAAGAEASPTTGDAAPAESATPSASPTPTPTPTSSPTPSVAVGFVSPSGNIACHITEAAARCDISDFSYDAPPNDGCADQWGDAIAVGADGAQFVCHADDVDTGSEALPYGDRVSAGEFTCTSAENGVTCRHDPTGASFRISRAAYALA